MVLTTICLGQLPCQSRGTDRGMQLKPMRLFTPAKINTILRILSKREDGFHEIFTHMVPISFFDELTPARTFNEALQFSLQSSRTGRA